MRENLVDASGVSGSTSAVTIFITADYHPGRSGAAVAHGKTTDGCREVHIEFVDLEMPEITLRVRADVVRTELEALYAATKEWHDLDQSRAELRSRDHAAFEALQTSMWTAVSRLIKAQHINAIAHQAYEAGVRDGREALQLDLQALLGIQHTRIVRGNQ